MGQLCIGLVRNSTTKNYFIPAKSNLGEFLGNFLPKNVSQLPTEIYNFNKFNIEKPIKWIGHNMKFWLKKKHTFIYTLKRNQKVIKTVKNITEGIVQEWKYNIQESYLMKKKNINVYIQAFHYIK